MAFKASTQETSRNVSRARGTATRAEEVDDEVLQRSGAVGVDALMGILKNYCRSLNIKTSISVGVVGYPNTGKSSIINSLKRCVVPSRPAPPLPALPLRLLCLTHAHTR